MQNLRRNVMHAVKVDRKKLLKIVTENKEKHIKEYNESVEDYKKAALKIAEANIELVKTGDLDQIARVKAMPTKPSSYENNYTRAIRMLELSVEKEIDVEEDVFNQLVLDEWAWKNAFVASASLYKSI
jgi:antitoxin component of RelBE/YafQ-DinJ toxin-antitoxin module